MYSVLLSPKDGDALGGFAETLGGELATYLLGYARERDYALAARPVVRFLIDDELKLGRFMVIGELLSPDEIAQELGEPEGAVHERVPAAAPEPQPRPAPQRTAVVPAVPDAEQHAGTARRAPEGASVTVPGLAHDVALEGERVVLGRLKTCDICVADANASREHAALEREGAGWAVVDLGSTNGTLVNGEPAQRVRLRDGDTVTIGTSELVYHEPRG